MTGLRFDPVDKLGPKLDSFAKRLQEIATPGATQSQFDAIPGHAVGPVPAEGVRIHAEHFRGL